VRTFVEALSKACSTLVGTLRHIPPLQDDAVRSGWQAATKQIPLAPLERVVLADEASRTLFEQYATHRKSPRRNEETGWVILGVREQTEAIVLATLPAGKMADAGAAHVTFNAEVQAVASRMVRQIDRRLTVVGVVHTHPGTLRHPSDGDYRGDSAWVGQLRGGEGIFGIGTAVEYTQAADIFGRQPRPSVQTLGCLSFSWYALKKGKRSYRPLPVGITLGPDLARPLHAVWGTLELHAVRMERLFRQQTGLRFEVIRASPGAALVLNVTLAEPGTSLKVIMEESKIRYLLERNGDILEPASPEPLVDRGIYQLLAQLAPGA
jgi:proteasome lid subunit RPN8/RPN11